MEDNIQKYNSENFTELTEKQKKVLESIMTLVRQRLNKDDDFEKGKARIRAMMQNALTESAWGFYSDLMHRRSEAISFYSQLSGMPEEDILNIINQLRNLDGALRILRICDLYNPFSLASILSTRIFENYHEELLESDLKLAVKLLAYSNLKISDSY